MKLLTNSEIEQYQRQAHAYRALKEELDELRADGLVLPSMLERMLAKATVFLPNATEECVECGVYSSMFICVETPNSQLPNGSLYACQLCGHKHVSYD